MKKAHLQRFILFLLFTFSSCQTISCFGKLSTDPTVCNSRGYCKETDKCICTQLNWTGVQCNQQTNCINGVCIVGNSCREIQAKFRLQGIHPPSDKYTLNHTTPYSAYCDMEYQGGGWTLALKQNGTSSTFHFDSPLWENLVLLNPNETNLEPMDAKFPSFINVPFNQLYLLLDVEDKSCCNGTNPKGNKLLLNHTSTPSLYNIFLGKPKILFPQQYAKEPFLQWAGPNSGLQSPCFQSGFNFQGQAERHIDLRLGMIGDEDPTCIEPDSAIGFGIKVPHSRDAWVNDAPLYAPSSPSVGNRCTKSACTPGNWNPQIGGHGYLFVRDTQYCFGLNECSGRGICWLNQCLCERFYSGPTCNVVTMNKCFGKLENETSICSGKGNCISTNVCQCSTGYAGAECQLSTCYGKLSNDTNVCSGKGTCISPDTCQCNSGVTGNECQSQSLSCFGVSSTDPNVCSGRGKCSSADLCVCNNGFTGNRCQFEVVQNTKCFGIASNNVTHVCSGFGRCFNSDKCECNSPTYGDMCQYHHFYWNPANKIGSFSNPKNWFIMISVASFLEAPRAPQENDTIFLTLPEGNIEITLNSSLTFKESINIGNTNSLTNYNLIVKKDVKFNALTLTKNARITIDDGVSVEFNELSRVDGQISFSKSNLLFKKGIIHQNNFTIPKDSNVTIENGNIEIGSTDIRGSLEIKNGRRDIKIPSFSISGKLIFKNESSTINSNFNVFGNLSFIDFNVFGTSLITNDGTLEFSSSKNIQSNLTSTFTIINRKLLEVSGEGTVFMHTFQKEPYSTFSLKNGNLKLTSNLNIDNGYFFASGQIFTNLLNITSNTGYFKSYEETLSISGSLFLLETCTMIIEIHGYQKNQQRLFVNENITINGLVYFKLGKDTNVEVGEQYKFLTYRRAKIGPVMRTVLMGAPYRNAVFNLQTTQSPTKDLIQQYDIQQSSSTIEPLKTADLYIDLSIGNLAYSDFYRCNYLGNRHMIEIIYFKENKKVGLTFTSPHTSGWNGFGFGNDRNISKAKLVVSSNMTPYRIYDHIKVSETQNSDLIDYGTFRSKSLFTIGYEYDSSSIFVSEEELQNQKFIFYAENYRNPIQNLTGLKHDNVIVYEFNLLNGSLTPCTNFLAPSLAETREPVGVAFLLFFYLFFFVLCLILYKAQPLYSRGLAPYSTLLLLILQLGFETRNHDWIPVEQRSLCLYMGYLLYPLQQLSFILVLIYFIKYFAIIRINSMKNNISVTINDGVRITEYSLKIRILKLLTQFWVIGILIVLYLIFSWLMATISMASSYERFLCSYNTLANLRLFHTILLFLIFLTLFGLIISDFIFNYEIIFKCQLYQFIFKKDPFFFRLQIILFIPFLIFSIITELVYLILLRNIVDIIRLNRTFEAINTIRYLFLFFIDVLFPLSISIIKLIKMIFSQVKSTDHLEYLLNNPGGYELMRVRCKEEYSIENLYAWKDIQEYKTNYKKNEAPKEISLIPKSESEEVPMPPTRGGQKENVKTSSNPNWIFAKFIFNKYFNGKSSVYETNVPAVSCKVIEKLLDDNTIDETLFDQVLSDVMINLSDTLFRLMQTKDYVLFMEKNKLEKELLQKNEMKETYFMKAIEETKRNSKKLSEMNEKRKSEARKSAIIQEERRKSIAEEKRKSQAIEDQRKSQAIEDQRKSQAVEDRNRSESIAPKTDAIQVLNDIKIKKLGKLKKGDEENRKEHEEKEQKSDTDHFKVEDVKDETFLINTTEEHKIQVLPKDEKNEIKQ